MARNERLRQYRILRNWRQQEVADQLGIALVTVQRWERGYQQPTAYYRAKLSALFGVSAQELGLLDDLFLEASPEKQANVGGQPAATLPDEQPQEQLSRSTKPEPPWNVPFARNPFFAGRGMLLERLHEQLFHNKRAALVQSAALSGLGGIGKTQTAIEYAYRYREEYNAVFWVRADSRDTLVADFVVLAQLLDLPGYDAQKQMQVVAAIKRWLEQYEGWLLILDNADELALLPDFLPREGNGHLLLTTRAQATGKLARSVSVDKMEMSEGIRLLLRRATLLSEDEPLEMVSATTRTAAQQLVEDLDGLPLALDQAGAYIEETGCRLAEYLALYGRHRMALLQRKSSMISDYPHTVVSTWTLSFTQIEQANPAAADLLRLCAFLHPDAIPEEIVTEGAEVLGPHLQEVAADPLRLNEVIQLLRRYSLVKRDAEARLLNLHRLVQVVLKESLDAPTQRMWAQRAVLSVNAAYPEVKHSGWPQCERLLAQALTAAQLIEQYQLVSAEAGRLLHETASYLRERARYQEAERLYQHALHIREQQLGPEHLNVASSLYGLAFLYRLQGKYEEAAPLYQRALRIREQQLGPEHPDVAQSLNGLAVLYDDQGKYAEAEMLHRRALHIREQQLGPDHPDVAQSLNNLAIFYHAHGNYAEAEPLYKRAKVIDEKALGPDHPGLAIDLSNLAVLYDDQGESAEAETLHWRALHIREQQLGPEHPLVAVSFDNLADLHRKQGKYAEAEALFQRSLYINEKALGPEHPELAYALTGLANLYREQGKYTEAEPLYRRALRIREQLEPTYPETAETLHDFAAFEEMQGNQWEARSLYYRALTIREHMLGAHHPKTTQTRTRLIAILRTMGQNEDAARLEADQSEPRMSEEEKAHLQE